MQNIYFFITIIKKSDFKEFFDFFLKYDAVPIYSSLCRGAASSETLSVLGLEQSEKILMQSIVSKSKMYELKVALSKEMSIDFPNRGIALAIPISSIASRKALVRIIESGALKEEDEDVIQRNERNIDMELELIIAICLKGNSDNIMKTARAAGAAGGTIIKAKGTASGSDMFFGMAISDEKELIYIVSKKETKSDIMKAVSSYTNEHGTHPLVFSLPVSESAGFRLLDNSFTEIQ